MRYLILSIILSIFCMQGPALAGFEEGEKAYKAKDYRKAFIEFSASANNKHPIAQYRLGQLYQQGRGTIQNFVEAHRWYNLAAWAVLEAEKARNSIAKDMTTEQIAEAQKLAAAWKPTGPDASTKKNVVANQAAPKLIDVINVQRLLTQLRYTPGPPDGKFGNKTQNAIKQFQSDVGLPVDGQISKKLRLTLLSKRADVSANTQSEPTKTIKSASDSTRDKQLLVAAEKGDQTTVQRLLADGVDPNFSDKDGWTALMFASAEGKTDVVDVLLQAKTDVDARTNKGETALYIATAVGKLDMVKTLVQKGANIEIRNNELFSPLDISEAKYKVSEEINYYYISEFLNESGAITMSKILVTKGLLWEMGFMTVDEYGKVDGMTSSKLLKSLIMFSAIAKFKSKYGLKDSLTLSQRVIKEIYSKFRGFAAAVVAKDIAHDGFLKRYHGMYAQNNYFCKLPRLDDGKDMTGLPLRVILWSEGNRAFLRFYFFRAFAHSSRRTLKITDGFYLDTVDDNRIPATRYDLEDNFVNEDNVRGKYHFYLGDGVFKFDVQGNNYKKCDNI